MKIIGIKTSACLVPKEYIGNIDIWEGYWSYKKGRFSTRVYTGIMRKSEYDAHSDAVRDAQIFSKENDITFITEGYVV